MVWSKTHHRLRLEAGENHVCAVHCWHAVLQIAFKIKWKKKLDSHCFLIVDLSWNEIAQLSELLLHIVIEGPLGSNVLVKLRKL